MDNRHWVGGHVVKSALLLLIAAALPAQAQVYKCRVGGTTVFSGQPCEPDAQLIDVRPASGAAPSIAPAPNMPTSPAINASNNPQAVVARMGRERALRELDARIDAARSSVTAEEAQMSREVAALRAQKARANNNLAGAMWEQSISQEMGAVVARYDVRIREMREEIKRLEGEREALRTALR